jgi:AGZA family xanthine/uracil permease-like MFS transporter
MLDRYFRLSAHGTSVRTELVAGATTFLTMAYIVFVNPMILVDAGMDRGAVFLAPLATTVPAYATAPALLFVACLMSRSIGEVDWEDATEYAPAIVTMLAMPLTFSIATGIGFGFICYAAGKVATGQLDRLSPGVVVVALAFLAKFALVA